MELVFAIAALIAVVGAMTAVASARSGRGPAGCWRQAGAGVAGCRGRGCRASRRILCFARIGLPAPDRADGVVGLAPWLQRLIRMSGDSPRMRSGMRIGAPHGLEGDGPALLRAGLSVMRSPGPGPRKPSPHQERRWQPARLACLEKT